MRDIDADEEITVPYLSLQVCKSDQRTECLREAFDLTCDCSFCNLPLPEQQPSELGPARLDINSCRQLLSLPSNH